MIGIYLTEDLYDMASSRLIVESELLTATETFNIQKYVGANIEELKMCMCMCVECRPYDTIVQLGNMSRL